MTILALHTHDTWAQSEDSNDSATLVPIFSLLLDEEKPVGSFSGTLSLPAGIQAGASGVTFTLRALLSDIKEVNGELVTLPSRTDVVIPAGMNSASYFLGLNRNPSFETKSLAFSCKSGCDNLDITTDGDWSETVGVGSFFRKTSYSSTEQHTVDIILEDADSFTGTVSMPVGITASGEESISVTVSETIGFLKASYNFTIQANAGETSWPFKVGVPTDSSTPSWRVSISCLACDESIPIEAQYASQASGDPMTLDSSSSHSFPADQDYTGINMRFLQSL